MQGFTFGQAAPAFGMFSGASPPPQPGAQQPAGFSFGQGPAAQAAEAQSPAGGFGGFAQPSQSSQPTSLFAFGASQPPQAQQQQQQQQPGPFGVPAQAAAQPQGGFAAFSQPAGGAPPPFGVSQQPQQQAPLGGAQQAQQSFPPAGPSAFGAGFAPQAAAQPSQPAIVGFGAMPPAATAPANFAGAPAPPAQPGTSLFSFGQAAGSGQPTAPTTAATPVSLFDPPATTAATPSAAFGFGTGAQQQVPAFLGGQQPAGAARPAFGSAAPKFDFGASAKRKEHQQQQGPPASGNASSGGAGQGGEEDGAMPDLEAEKQRALASMPKFGGSSGGGMKAGASGGVAALLSRAGGTAARPRGRSPSPAPSSQKDVDAEEQARRAQRAARFNAAAALAAGTAGGGGADAPSPAALLASVVAGSAGYPSSSKGGRGASGTGAMRRVPSSLTANLAVQGAGGGFDEGDAMGADEDEEGAGSHRSAIVGTCEDMCPEEERNRRQGMNDLQIFERDPQAPSTTNASLAVKRFARTVDDPHPSQFRTRAALQRTMAHLRGILDRTDVRLGLVHKFLWDRYRSVRQDLYIQGIQDAFGVRIFEEIVRFHILSEHELCAEDQSVTDMEGFNSHLNMEQMNKALISLDDMYNKLAAAGTPVDTEPEFRAYHLLSLMSQHGKFKGDQQVYLGTIKGLRDEVKSSPAVQWVLSLQQAFASSNAVRFFSLTRQAPYLLACLAHIYFPQMRKRVLRMLSETLSPSPARPAAIELSWLQEVLLLDTLDEAAELATTYGFEVFTENGIAAALLVKGGFTEPEQPALRRPSQLIRSMAQGARSTVVTTPALPPMSADQLAQFEAQRLETRLRQQEAAVQAQHAAAAEAQRRQQAELVAAQAAQQAQQEAREQRRREEVMQQVLAQQAAEEQRAREAEAQRQHAIEVAARQQQEVAWRLAQEAERRAKEEEQRRWHAEQARQAAEAQRARQEAAWREAQAREAERRRLAQEEERRLAEQRRVEEEKRRRRAVKQRMAITRLYFARWRREAAWLAAERARQARVRASLKACRVGFASSRTAAASSSAAEQAAQQAEDGLPGLQQDAVGPQQAQQAKQQGLDLPSLVAPLLVQRSPSADALYWKVVLLGTAAAAGTAQHQLSVLGRWLAQQLSRGRLVGSPAGRAYVDGPITLQVGSGSGPRLSTCVVQPHALNALLDPHSGPSTLSATVAGASAIIVPVGPLLGPANGRLPYQDGHIPHGFGQSNGGSSSMSHVGLSFVDGFGSGAASAKLEPLWQVLGALPQGIRVPVLLVAPDLPAAQQWQELVRQQQQQGRLSGRVGSSSSRGGPLLHVVSASAQQQPHKAGTSLDGSGPANNSGIGPPLANGASSGVEAATSFSVQQLVQGLRWLAARAPQQPVLEVGSLEEAAREGLGLVVQALHQGSDQGGAAPEDYVDAFNAVLSLVADAIRNALQSPAAAWQWPPAELSPPALKQWHSEASMDQLLDSLAAVHLRADQQMPPSTGGAQQTALALYHRLGALDRLAPPLILPHEVHALLRRRLADAAADAAAAVLRRRQQQRQLALPARVPRFNQTLHIENGVGGAAGRSAADASAVGWRDAAAGMKRKLEPESQSVGQHDNQRRPGASQVQQQPLLPCSGPQAGSGIGRGQGVRQLHSALQRLQQQLAQESEAQQRLSVQAHDLSYGAAGAPAPDVNEACSTGLRDGILAPGAVAGTAAASNAAAEPKGSAARAPGALGELLFRLQAERQAAASLQANLQTAAALL